MITYSFILYPTSFTIAGIVADGSQMDEGQRNGKEPFTEYVSRMHFMNLCFQRNYGLWVKDGAYALLDILLVKFLS